MKPSSAASRAMALILLAAAFLPAEAFASDIPKDLLQQRDPFKMPFIKVDTAPKSPLEMYPADHYKLIGVLAGPSELRAMIASPDGKTYFVRTGMILGTRKGSIRKITETAIVVREKITNVLGEPENVDTVIKLPSDSKHDVRMTTLEHGW